MKLSQAFVKRITCKENLNKQEFYDDELKGFILEIRANGRKTYYLRATTPEGKRHSTKIGDATIITEADARTKALKLKRSIEEGKEVMLSPKPQNGSVPTLEGF